MALSATASSGLGLAGLSSGLDTSGIITKLMAIESAPQTALKARLSTATTYRTALQSLNTAIASITTTASAAAKAGSLASFTASTDAFAVTATASATASAGSVSFTVDALASAQVSITGAMSTWTSPGGSATPDLTIVVGGASKTVRAASTNLDDVVKAVNDAGTGVTATKVATGSKDGAGNALYRVQLRGATGAANGFTVYNGTDSSAPKATVADVSTAQNASITLYKDVPGAKQTVTSATNTFSSLLTGVDVTVNATTTTDATVTIAADATAATTAAQTLTTGLSTLFAGIAASSAITTTTSSTGASTATSGSVFTGDSLVRSLKDSLLTAVSGALPGSVSPSTIGINLTKDGTITFDQSVFAAAMAKDPKGATATFQTIAGRVASAATAASDPVSGSLTQKIRSQQGTESSLTKQIGDWDLRLAAIQAQYQAQFNNLETALNSLSSQASYLTGQLAGLTSNYQSTR